jgi:hypothetical protein
MSSPTQEEIRSRAHQLWQAAGEPAGHADAFWYQVEKELIAEGAERGEVPPGMTDNLPI